MSVSRVVHAVVDEYGHLHIHGIDPLTVPQLHYHTYDHPSDVPVPADASHLEDLRVAAAGGVEFGHEMNELREEAEEELAETAEAHDDLFDKHEALKEEHGRLQGDLNRALKDAVGHKERADRFEQTLRDYQIPIPD